MDRENKRMLHQLPAPVGVGDQEPSHPGSSATLAVKGWHGLYIEAALGVPAVEPTVGLLRGGEDWEDPDV